MAPRATRVTSIQLGPIIFEAGVISAVGDEGDTGLVSLCDHAHTKGLPDGPDGPKDFSKDPAERIKRRDFCPTCDNDDKAKFVKGRPLGDSAVIIPAAELEAVKALDEAAKKTVVLNAHPADQLTRVFPSGKSYFLAPRGPAAAGNYLLLRELLTKRPDIAFVGEFSFGGAASLYQILVDAEGVLVMRQLARPELVKERPSVEGEANAAYLDLLIQLAEATSTPFDAEAYKSKRNAAVAALLEKAGTVALGSGDTGTPAAAPAGDMAAVLKAALAAAAPAAPPAAKTPRRRATKKTAA